MKFNIMTECTSCNERKLCNEILIEYEGKQRVMNFCKECDNEIKDILIWANEYSFRHKNEVECPYCYAVYDIDRCVVAFQCSSCESTLEVEFDENENPYKKIVKATLKAEILEKLKSLR